eukprot:TCALIF_09341-PA protein Name:"Similar to CG8399 Putative ferric-chelate reductase 1 homolog (Drosophila melanogaster)" AED:0.04 eAED:0.07 QI:0/0/0/0.66/1/1/3/0/663
MCSDAQALSCDGVEGSATTHTSPEDKTAVTMEWSHPNFDSGESNSDAQALSCDGVEGSATTHTSPEDKTAVTMEWSHPNFDSGESKSVTFLYSVVKTFDTYWANEAIAQALTVTSNVATESTASKPDPETLESTASKPDPETLETTEEKAETSAAPKVAAEEETKSGPEVVIEAESGPEVVAEAESEPERKAEAESEPEVKAEESRSPEGAAKLNQNECGSNKGCFGMPANCEEAGNCKVMLTYAPAADNNFRLELQGRSIGSGDYMSCGLSLDDSMGGDLVLACLGGTSLKAFWNKNNAKSNVEGVTGVEFLNPSFSSENGLTKCSFEMNPKINAKLDAALNEPNFNLDLAASNFHVLLAEGAVSSSKLTYHTTKVASSQPVDFQSVSKVAGSTDVLIRVHGILMVLAWMACASSGMFMARYFKETWKGKQFCSKDIWFRFHQLLMGLTVILTLIAIIIIFIDRGTAPFGTEAIKENAHPILGIITFVLSLIQPLMAAVRPHPQDTYRWVFNWAHWGCGNIAWLLAIVAIFLAADLGAANFIPTSKFYWQIGAFVVVHFCLHLLMTFQRCWAMKDTEVQDISHGTPLSQYGSTQVFQNEIQSKQNDLRGSALRITLLIIYLAFVWVLSVHLMVALGLGETGRDYWVNGESAAEGEAEGEAES